MTSGPAQAIAPVVRAVPGPGRYMCGLTWTGGYLWHSDQEAGKIYAIDPADGTVAATLDCPQARADLTCHDGLLCQVGGRPKRLLVIDPATGQLAGQKEVPPPSGRLCGIEMGPEGMWMCLRDPSVVQLRDYATMSVLREYPVPGEPSGLTYADGVVVYSEFQAGLMHAFDTRSQTMLGTTAVRGHPTGTTWDGTLLWYCDFRAREFAAVELGAVAGGTVAGGTTR